MSVNRWPCNCSPYGNDIAVGEEDFDALLTEVRFLKGVAKGIADENDALRAERDEARGAQCCGGDKPYICHELATARSELRRAAALLNWCDNHWRTHLYEGSPSVVFLSRISEFVNRHSAAQREPRDA